MRWASAVAIAEDATRGIEEAAEQIDEQLEGVEPDLVVVFNSSGLGRESERVPAAARAALGGGMLLGCSAGGVIGGGTEVEEMPAVSVTAAVLPDVELIPFYVDDRRLPQWSAAIAAWERLLGVKRTRNPNFIVLPDPFSFSVERFLKGLDTAYPGSPKIGGLASSGRHAGENSLYLGASVYESGAVGVAMVGNVDVDTVVAQGCRPIGEPMFVTQCSDNLILEIDGSPPLEVLRGLHGRLSEADREIFRHSLFLGMAIDGDREQYRRGDFLVRNLLSVEEATGALSVGAPVREKQVVQFQLRDRDTSANDIESMLARYTGSRPGAQAEGSLLFTCMGRGQGLYGQSDHDTDAFRRHVGDIPLGGFFCNGEIGEVEGRTFLHGYTSSFGIFRSQLRA